LHCCYSNVGSDRRGGTGSVDSVGGTGGVGSRGHETLEETRVPTTTVNSTIRTIICHVRGSSSVVIVRKDNTFDQSDRSVKHHITPSHRLVTESSVYSGVNCAGGSVESASVLRPRHKQHQVVQFL